MQEIVTKVNEFLWGNFLIILLNLGFISNPVEAINKPCLPPKKEEVISNS